MLPTLKCGLPDVGQPCVFNFGDPGNVALLAMAAKPPRFRCSAAAARSVSVVSHDGAQFDSLVRGPVSSRSPRARRCRAAAGSPASSARATAPARRSFSMTAPLRRQRDGQLRIAVAAGLEDLARGALGRDREPGQRVGDREPRVLRFVLPLDVGVDRRAGPHQPGRHRGHADAVLARARRGPRRTGRPARTCWRSTARGAAPRSARRSSAMLTMRPKPRRRIDRDATRASGAAAPRSAWPSRSRSPRAPCARAARPGSRRRC